jgi:hypothetical protein
VLNRLLLEIIIIRPVGINIFSNSVPVDLSRLE